MKQGEEKLKFVKDKNNTTENYVFQKNKKTIRGAVIILSFLVIALVAIIISGISLQ